jgi:catechol 2,3-dioxygenase-like lactoylglutathione lyase family enzyme
MPALLTGFHHIAIHCRDYNRSEAFYKALGFQDMLSWGEGDERACMLSVGGVCVELFASYKGESPAGKWVHLALTAPDCNAAYNAALAAGATVQIEPKSVVIQTHTGPYPVRLAFVYGPDGEVIEFFQPE